MLKAISQSVGEVMAEVPVISPTEAQRRIFLLRGSFQGQ